MNAHSALMNDQEIEGQPVNGTITGGSPAASSAEVDVQHMTKRTRQPSSTEYVASTQCFLDRQLSLSDAEQPLPKHARHSDTMNDTVASVAVPDRDTSPAVGEREDADSSAKHDGDLTGFIGLSRAPASCEDQASSQPFTYPPSVEQGTFASQKPSSTAGKASTVSDIDINDSEAGTPSPLVEMARKSCADAVYATALLLKGCHNLDDQESVQEVLTDMLRTHGKLLSIYRSSQM